ncbi:optic atrophy 3 protein-domain-containing protein [Pavlovales sp. CCMP2436]|nr:optic atrophy 3 protein-domain-containing protein [Pavlovales sp. CCMP2436]|mmetsp:Transcript_17945/g.45975  ORF Transcript_17945/g.45975 Transcript_17945/m.45975 type:complete len:171 (+) Transcript_17945:144-656(+)
MAVALVGKLGLVAIKQISKPVASFVKREAKAHPMLAFPLEVAGGVTHRLSINFQRLVLGKSWLSAGSIHTMSPLTREHAIDQGAELLGESVIFGIAGATVAFELIRQNRAKEAASAKSEANERLKWEAVRLGTVERDDMRRDIGRLSLQLEDLQVALAALEERASGRWFR